MTSWPVAGQMLSYTDATTGATPLAIMKTAIKTGDASVLNQLPDAMSLLFGATGDTFGAVSQAHVRPDRAEYVARDLGGDVDVVQVEPLPDREGTAQIHFSLLA
jgi:hypothetical protein